MEQLGRRVRVKDVEISDDERIYGRRFAGREGQIEGVSREPGDPRGGLFPGGIASYTVRLDNGELITVRPEEVRAL